MNYRIALRNFEATVCFDAEDHRYNKKYDDDCNLQFGSKGTNVYQLKVIHDFSLHETFFFWGQWVFIQSVGHTPPCGGCSFALRGHTSPHRLSD